MGDDRGRRDGVRVDGPSAEGASVDGAATGDLLERAAELAGLSQALAAACRGAGSLVVVEGPAGIGKSRLLSAAGEVADGLGMAVCRARGIELERGAPFGVASELFAPALIAASGEERSRLLAGHAALAASLFDPAVPGQADPSALVRGLYWLTVNLASGSRTGDAGAKGLLIEVDDAQWADQSSLGFLAFLAARLGELPVVLAVAVRGGEEPTDRAVLDWLRDRPGRVLKPRPLSAGAVDRMVAAGLPGAEPEFTHACAEVSGGNPFLAWELVRALRDDGIPPVAGSVSRVRRLVPDSVLHSVLVRLARLGEPARRLAESVAVLADGTPLRRARLLAGLDPLTAEAAADMLAEAHILGPGEPLRFAHPLIANAVYADLAAYARARAHRRAAGILEADAAPVGAVAAHLLLTRPDGDRRTVSILRSAAGQAMGRGDPDVAAHLLARALEEPPEPAGRAALLLDLADAEMQCGQPAAAEHIDEALALLGESADRTRGLTALGRLRFTLGEHRAGAEAMDQALSRLAPDDPAMAPLLADYLTLTTFRAPLHPLAEQRLRPVVAAARQGRPPEHPALLAHLVLRLAFAAEPPSRLRPLAERATAADPLIDPATHGILMGMVVQALCCVDELDSAERLCDAALAAARRCGSLLGYSMACYSRAIGRYHRGDLVDALADLDQAMVASREGWTAGDPWNAALQVHAQLERGDLAAARDALALTAAEPDSMDQAIALSARARLALADGRPAEALADAREAGRVLSSGFGIDHPGFVPWRRVAVLAADAAGRPEQAHALASEMVERARWTGTARALGLALRTQAAISPGEQRLPLLAEAVDVLRQSPSALQRAHALVELGAAHRRAGRRSAAQPPLREGLQLSDGMGAVPLVQRARQELLATGARPRRAAHTGPDALTPTERRVAELAAENMTNSQIAQALFVTTKTIQTHLGHAYRKLGIDSRRDLPAALARR